MPHLFLLSETDMYYVYVLAESETGKTYIGFTKDLRERVAQHNSGKGSRYTKSGTWKLVYYEAFLSRKDAMTRERRLKQEGRDKRQLFERIHDCLTGQK